VRENAGPDWTTTWRFNRADELHSSVLTSPAAWTFEVTLRMVDTLDSQSEPLRMRAKFFSSGIAEQRTFSIGGSVWSTLASYRDYSITRAKPRILRRAKNDETSRYAQNPKVTQLRV
jgi:hypothetical protein